MANKVEDDSAHAFMWSRETGLTELCTLGGKISTAVAIGAAGQVAGHSTVRDRFPSHVYIWTRQDGMQDLGPAGDAEALAWGMSANGHMFGVLFHPDQTRHAFSWTRTTGMVEIGTFGGQESLARGVNNKGQVVGGSFTMNNEDFHAFVWTAKDGLVDLNSRLRDAPAGLVLRSASAISDNGYIAADSNAGLVLLVPDGSPTGTRTVGPMIGPVAASDFVQPGASFESSVSFSNGDTAARHNIMWNWGDGSGDQQGNARESKGAGVASANHRYTTPGMYTVTAKVGDHSGKGPTVSRTIVVYDPAPGSAAGKGWFVSPYGAHKVAGSLADRVEFSFVLPSAASSKAGNAKSRLSFIATGLDFRSDDFKLVATQGGRVQFDGSGTLNGKGNLRLTLNTTAGGEGKPGRLGLKIWHVDPASKKAVVDYDNQQADPDGMGSSFRGKILVH